MNFRKLFEDELRRRGLDFSVDAESGRHAIEIGGGQMLVSLDNLQRDVAGDGDMARVSRFVDAIVESAGVTDSELSADQLYWCLEPSDYEERADFRVAISNRVDRALVCLSGDGGLITWVTPDMLESLGLGEEEAGKRAFVNLRRALSEASVTVEDVDGVALGIIGTSLPIKASLILAPNLREVVEPVLGWPLLAVCPDRDFLYLWAARHTDFVHRVGGVVVNEYSQASYPISTEVFEIGDDEIRAIGAFTG